MRSYLAEGYKLINGTNIYTIKNKIGEGGSCVAYSAIDDSNGKERIIKEYYPLSLALTRLEDGILVCNETEKEKLDIGINEFVLSIETQNKLKSKESIRNQIFDIIDSFSMNNTYYAVVTASTGRTFQMATDLSLYDKIRVCRSVVDYVGRCHSLGFLCLDIKPQNIFVMPETSELAMFFDFDSICSIEDVKSGKTTSYTEDWAAPEQLLPGNYDDISVSTVIYTLGELVFWSVFDRHSLDEEHRRWSEYDFRNSKFWKEITSTDAEHIFIEIFHNTLRSSAKNRYKSVDELVFQLDELLILINPSRKIYREKFFPYPTSFFIGRDKEIKEIKNMLDSNKRVFIHGIGGIGKSEIVKQYIKEYKENYNSITYLTYDYDIITTINDASFLSGLPYEEEEKLEHYCERKIREYGRLLSGRNLLVIDNYDEKLELSDHKEIWNILLSLPCDILITTRSNQNSYSECQIEIHELGYDELVELFSKYCDYSKEEMWAVKNIIEEVHFLTVVVELIAKQAFVSEKKPSEVLKELTQRGVLGLKSEMIDYNWEEGEVSYFIRKLFFLTEMPKDARRMLVYISFMPQMGIPEASFLEFFKYENHNSIRYLIDNGWVYESKELSRVITVHPVIRSVVMDFLKNNEEDAKQIYYEILYLMKECFETDFENIGKTYIFFRSIVMTTCLYLIEIEDAANIMNIFICVFGRYGHNDEKKEILLKSIYIYNQIFCENEYVAAKEMSHILLYSIEALNVEELEIIFYSCKKHLEIAKKNNDIIIEAFWCQLMIKCYSIGINMGAIFVDFTGADFFKILIKLGKIMRSKIYKKIMNNPEFTETYGKSLHYGYLSYIHWGSFLYSGLKDYCEIDLEDAFYKDTKIKKLNYKIAIHIRERIKEVDVLNTVENRAMINVDYARNEIACNNYGKAEDLLLEAVHMYELGENTKDITIYNVHRILGKIYFVTYEFEKAIVEYKKCLAIADEISYKKVYNIKTELFYALLFRNKIQEGFKIANDVMEELTKDKNPYNRIYMAEIAYNIAYYLFVYTIKNNDMSFKAFIDENLSYAENVLNESKGYTYKRKELYAKIMCLLGKKHILLDDMPSEAKNNIKMAYSTYKSIFGKKHPETIKCKEILKKIKKL